jgi:hypothetical protein
VGSQILRRWERDLGFPAEVLEMDRGNIAKLEKRTDMYLSTLRSYVEAMGGALEISAVFPDGTVKIYLLNHLR